MIQIHMRVIAVHHIERELVVELESVGRRGQKFLKKEAQHMLRLEVRHRDE
jgi:hypothetical protein